MVVLRGFFSTCTLRTILKGNGWSFARRVPSPDSEGQEHESPCLGPSVVFKVGRRRVIGWRKNISVGWSIGRSREWSV